MTDVEITGNLSTFTVGGNEKAEKDPSKQPTFAEKLMGVRNTQSEMHLKKRRDQIQQNELRQMERIREETNRIEYDLKTMKVMKKKRDLEVKRLKSPYLDTEQDVFEIKQAERYLVFDPNICFYTNKKNTIPLRSLAKLDPYHTTPTISKARKILQDMTNEKRVQSIQKRAHSRRSARSVRFETPHSETATANMPQHKVDETSYGYPGMKNVPSQSYKRNNSSPYGHHSGGYESPELRKEALLSYLKRAKSKTVTSQEFQSEADNIPDDFTQCIPSQTSKSLNYATFAGIDDTDNQNVLLLPSVSGEEKTQSYVNSEMGKHAAAEFGEIEKELPPHELKLLKQANRNNDQLGYPRSTLRPTKSAGTATRSATNTSSYIQRRQMSATSANSLKRQQYTHAVMRKENKEVESRVQSFLNTFEKNAGKRRNVGYQGIFLKHTSENKLPEKTGQIVSFKEVPDHELSDTQTISRPRTASPEKLQRDLSGTQTGQNQRASTAVAKSESMLNPVSSLQLGLSSVKDQLNAHNTVGAQAQKSKIRGIPSNAEGRSKRHSATYKLRKIVQDLINNRTKQQMLEYEKMKTEGNDDSS